MYANIVNIPLILSIKILMAITFVINYQQYFILIVINFIILKLTFKNILLDLEDKL